MVALLSLLRSDYKYQQPLQQPSGNKKGGRSSVSSIATTTASTMRTGVVLANRRASNAGDNNNYNSGNDTSMRTTSTREVVFPDSFEVLPQPRDLSVVYMGMSHELQRKFRCRFCGKGYRWKSTMRRHETVECGGKPPAFQCPECPYKARQRGNLTVHYKRHHQKIEYDEGA